VAVGLGSSKMGRSEGQRQPQFMFHWAATWFFHASLANR
jgi:hypothetical protein